MAGMCSMESASVKIFFFFLQGTIIEFIVTFVFVTVIIMVALDTKSKTGLAPVIIGFTLAVCILSM
jgi:glycerol uptake facilitator-like aquaporin